MDKTDGYFEYAFIGLASLLLIPMFIVAAIIAFPFFIIGKIADMIMYKLYRRQ